MSKSTPCSFHPIWMNAGQRENTPSANSVKKARSSRLASMILNGFGYCDRLNLTIKQLQNFTPCPTSG